MIFKTLTLFEYSVSIISGFMYGATNHITLFIPIVLGIIAGNYMLYNHNKNLWVD